MVGNVFQKLLYCIFHNNKDQGCQQMERTSRKEFIRKLVLGGASIACTGSLLLRPGSLFLSEIIASPPSASPPSASLPAASPGKQSSGSFPAKEAMFYSALPGNRVQCRLCPHQCIVADRNNGLCRVRSNISGKLYSRVYGKPCTVDVGPIEKAPLYHFIPGHKRLCVATVGCNLRCTYCHNWHISQTGPGTVREFEMTPEQIVGEAFRRGTGSISFTYTEPTVFYEYMYDISRIAHRKGLKVSIVSNGYINPAPLRQLLHHVDAVKIDLKAFRDAFYRDVASARLEPVLSTLQVLKEENVFFEIVNLVVPGLNDDANEIKQMCDWICKELGDHVPVHFSRFFPSYRLTNIHSTSVRTLERAVKTAQRSGLRYVYIGNVPGHKNNSTYCPGCAKRLVHRSHFSVLGNNIAQSTCNRCGYAVHGIWE